MIAGLDHVQFTLPPGGEVAARAFYADVLGLAETPKPPALAARGGVWFALADGRQLHLGVEHPFRPNAKAHAALAVADGALDALAERLAAAGHPVQWDDAPAGRRRFYTRDPFGNRVELTVPAGGASAPPG